jgi:hypothetical protein
VGRDQPHGDQLDEGAPRLVKGEAARVEAAGEGRPQRHQGEGDDPRLRHDDEQVGQRVAAVAGVEQELRVQQHPDGGDEHQHHQRRRARLRDVGRGRQAVGELPGAVGVTAERVGTPPSRWRPIDEGG